MRWADALIVDALAEKQYFLAKRTEYLLQTADSNADASIMFETVEAQYFPAEVRNCSVDFSRREAYHGRCIGKVYLLRTEVDFCGKLLCLDH